MRRKHIEKKKKYIIAAIVIGAATLLEQPVWAFQSEVLEDGEDSLYSDMGDSEEEDVYHEFLKNGENFSDIKMLSDVMYATYDINEDNKKELIIRGKASGYGKYEYYFYKYKDGKVKTIGSMENWQNAGEGEMYYVERGKEIVVYTSVADRKSYTLYQVNNRIKYSFEIYRQSLDIEGKDGEWERKYNYCFVDQYGEENSYNITQKDWDEFEQALIEIPFYDVEVIANNKFTDEQINMLKRSLGVPDDVKVEKFVSGEPWYWEGTGRWIISIEMYDKDDIFLAGAAIDPDTLELQREIAPYNLERIEQDRAARNIEDDTGEYQGTQLGQQKTPFYGIWCYASREEAEANSYVEVIKNSGFDARVFVTTDWSNLNDETFYVVTAGIYQTEDEANEVLADVRNLCADAYIKYSGDFLE